jgi:5'-nucleotidase
VSHSHTYHPDLESARLKLGRAQEHIERLKTEQEVWGRAHVFLGGVEKAGILEAMRPHIYFDDQMTHLERARLLVPSAHVLAGGEQERRWGLRRSNPSEAGRAQQARAVH